MFLFEARKLIEEKYLNQAQRWLGFDRLIVALAAIETQEQLFDFLYPYQLTPLATIEGQPKIEFIDIECQYETTDGYFERVIFGKYYYNDAIIDGAVIYHCHDTEDRIQTFLWNK